MHWETAKTFTSRQAELLVLVIQSSQFSGRMRISPGGGPTTSPAPVRPHGTLGRPRDTGEDDPIVERGTAPVKVT